MTGFGITRLLSYQIAPALAEGKLKVVLEDFDTMEIPVHIVHREGRYTSAKVRSFVDFMTEQLRNQKALN